MEMAQKTRVGRGAEGDVFKVYSEEMNKFVAVKIMKHWQKLYESMSNEAELLDESRHPRVIELLDMGTRDKDGRAFMVFELMDSDLTQVIRDCRALSPGKIRSVMRQLLEGLAFIHSKEIVHQDVKPANILVRGEQVKLADFGHARHLWTPAPETFGTLLYNSPEQLQGQKQLYSTAVDVWAAGCVFAELLLGRKLFAPKDWVYMGPAELKEALLERIQAWDPCCLGREVHDYEALWLLANMLEVDPCKRVTAQDALGFDYFRGDCEDVQVPALPGTSSELLVSGVASKMAACVV